MAAMKKSTGRSADASAGAAAAKKATTKARATGQTKSSAMDAVSRRYQPNNELYTNGTNTRLFSTVDDKRYNREKSSKKAGMRMTEKVLRTGPAKVSPANKAKAAAAKAKATGQTKESSLDAAGRRYKPVLRSVGKKGNGGVVTSGTYDRLTGKVRK